MEKIRDFLKNYKTILLLGLAGLLAICFFSVGMTAYCFYQDVSAVNTKQLPKIWEKAVQIRENLGGSLQKYQQTKVRPEEALKNLLALEGDEAAIGEYLAVCQGVWNNTENKDTGKKTEDSEGTLQRMLWKISGFSVGLDPNSYFAAVNLSDGAVIYSEIEGFYGTGIVMEERTENIWETSDGQYTVQYLDVPEEDVRLFALTPVTQCRNRCIVNVLVITVIFLLLLVVLIAYIICLRQAELDPKEEYQRLGKYFLHTQTVRFRSMALVLGILAAAAYIVLTGLNDTTHDLAYLERESENCVEVFESYNRMVNTLEEARSSSYYDYGRLTGVFLSRHPEYLNKEGMEKLAEALGVRYLSVYNADGSCLCTSSSMDHLNILTEDKESPLYDLRYCLMGKEGVTVSIDSALLGEKGCLYAVPRRMEDKVADGAIVITGGEEDRANLAELDTDILELQRNRSGSIAFVVNDMGVILTDTKTAAGLTGIDEGLLQDDYIGRIKINGLTYLTSVKYIDFANKYVFVLTPYKRFRLVTLGRCTLVLLFYMLLVLIMWYDGLGSRYRFEKRSTVLKDADDWERTELKWEELSVGQKMSRILRICIYTLSIGCVAVWSCALNGSLQQEVLRELLKGSWRTSVNGYSIVANICIVMVFYSGISLVEYLLEKLEIIAGEDCITGTRLLKSLIKYVGALACAFIVVTNFGVDAATALASIGIVGFALSFGAQELVKDMIAGMFILFEGNFKVGDMLDIGGDWYWIRSIGVRTTKVEAWGSVKVINNSQMTGIVNIQNASSVVNCDVMIANRYDLKEVESYMRSELPELKQKLEADVSTPTWKGIQSISAAGTVIRTRCYCPPIKQGYVGRMLRAEVREILERHGIELAFDAIAIHSETKDPEIIREELRQERELSAEVDVQR